ncbi:MAG: hypothetical protein LBJ57_05285, partial [Prevotellaceae bacterium]|nr:hypothetical protein [Prevotellaceae bacterium]
MSQAENTVRLNKVTREFNLGLHTIVDFLAKKGIAVDVSPNAKISEDTYALLAKEFGNEQSVKDKEAAKKMVVVVAQKKSKEEEEEPNEPKPLIVKDTSVFTLDKPVLSGPKATGERIDVEAIGKGGKKSAAKVKEQASTKKKIEESPEQQEAPQSAVTPQAENVEHKDTTPPQEESQEKNTLPTVAEQEVKPEPKPEPKQEPTPEPKQEKELKPQKAEKEEVEIKVEVAQEAHSVAELPQAEPPQAGPEKNVTENELDTKSTELPESKSETETETEKGAGAGTVKVVGKIDLD